MNTALVCSQALKKKLNPTKQLDDVSLFNPPCQVISHVLQTPWKAKIALPYFISFNVLLSAQINVIHTYFGTLNQFVPKFSEIGSNQNYK